MGEEGGAREVKGKLSGKKGGTWKGGEGEFASS